MQFVESAVNGAGPEPGERMRVFFGPSTAPATSRQVAASITISAYAKVNPHELPWIAPGDIDPFGF